MSELVELRREQSIREYECMKHLRLFTESEISDIKTKRLHYEYRIERRAKSVSDFINYIDYERNLYRLLKVRRHKLLVKAATAELDRSIKQHILALYKRALARFPSEYRMWTHFMRHCEDVGFLDRGSRALESMLRFHGDKTKAWLSAINWEYRLVKDVARAKHFNLRGLQRHPECRELALSLIGIHLQEARVVVAQSKEKEKALLESNDAQLMKHIKMAQVVYENFKLKDVEFYRQLMEELVKYRTLSNELANEAVQDMRTLLAEKEEMWDLLANLALQGNRFVMEKLDSTSMEQLEKCVTIYDEAIAHVTTKSMFTLYIDSMLKLNAGTQASEREAKANRKALASAFQKALAVDLLEAEKMHQYLKLLLHNPSAKDELVRSIVDKAVEQYPQSATTWTLYLCYLINKEAQLEQLESTFRQALRTLPETVSKVPLWEMLLHYYQSRSKLCGDDKVVELFRKAVDQEPAVSHHFQPLFLQYLASNTPDGIAQARNEYRRIVKNCTTPLEVHLQMAHLEKAQEPKKDPTQWRFCFENATRLYGKEKPSVWLEYIEFERYYGKPSYMQTLYERAKATLDDEAFADFLPRFELLKNPDL